MEWTRHRQIVAIDRCMADDILHTALIDFGGDNKKLEAWCVGKWSSGIWRLCICLYLWWDELGVPVNKHMESLARLIVTRTTCRKISWTFIETWTYKYNIAVNPDHYALGWLTRPLRNDLHTWSAKAPEGVKSRGRRFANLVQGLQDFS